MGCPGGMSTISHTRISIYARFSGQFFFKFSYKKIVMRKKDRCAVFGCNKDRLFPEKYTLKFSFCPKSARKYWASAPGHPIILLKSNKFNMAAVSVKRSIINKDLYYYYYYWCSKHLHLVFSSALRCNLCFRSILLRHVLRHGSPHNLHNLAKWHLKRIVLISRRETWQTVLVRWP